MPDDEGYLVLHEIFESFRDGLLRLLKFARATHAFLGAYESYLSLKREGETWTEGETVTRFLARLPEEDQPVIEYMAPLTQLIYATTLVDTFLSSITTFLLLRY